MTTSCKHCGADGEDTGGQCPRCERNRDTGQTLDGIILDMSHGDKLKLTVEERTFVLYYDEQGARGDDGLPVRGDVTGEYEVWLQTGPDDVRDLREVARVHVSPHGSSGYGNDRAKFHSANVCATAIMRTIGR